MNKRGILKLAAVVCLVAALFALPTQVAAEDGVPQPVLDAKAGVLRIITVGWDGVYTGTGFAVGTDSRQYVVTNAHVVEDAEDIYIYYDTGKYVTASVYYQDLARDVAVLKPDNTMPRVETLAVETSEFESGIAVYALGYPAAADYFTQTYEEEYDTAEQFLASVTADKQSMTITNGIISAMHNSTLIGDGSRTVETLQTNTALNGGNSGGPLLNNAGRVVGINTMGLSIADSINGAVHANELQRVLRDARVRFDGTPEEGAASTAQGGGFSAMTVILILMGVAVVGGGIAVAVILLRQKKRPLKNAITLESFERTYRKVEEMATLEMALRFVEDLLPMAQYDLNPLLTPDNVLIGDTALALKNKTAKMQPGVRPVYPGYSAPEVLNGRAGPPASVYFVGAVMYTMLTGHRPTDARQRLAENTAAFREPDAIRALVNRAMEPYEQNRVQDMYQLAAAMQQLAADLRARQGVAF